MILQRITSVYIALLFSVFLLAFPAGGYAEIDTFKYGLFLAVCGGYCVAVIVVRVQLAITGIRPFGKIRDAVREIPLAMRFLFMFLLFAAISALLSPHAGVFIGSFRQEGLLTIAIYVISTFFLTLYFRPENRMLLLIGISVCLFCLLAFVQLTGANPFTLFPEGFNYYGADVYFPGAFISTIGNAGLGGAFVSIIAGVFSMILIKNENRRVWLLAIPLFLTVLLIFEMNIDAAVLALAVGFLLMLPVAATNREELKRTLLVAAVIATAFAISQVIVFGDGNTSFEPRGLVFLAGAATMLLLYVVAGKVKWSSVNSLIVTCLLVVGALLYLWFFGARHGGMMYEASQIMRGNWDDSFGSGRIFIWRNVIENISASNLLFGTGPDTLVFLTKVAFEYDIHIDAAHNEYLHIFATLGLFAFLSYMGFLATLAVQWYRRTGNKLSAIAGAGVLFYCIQAFFGISMPITAPFFWVCAAVLIGSSKSDPAA